ncbi:gamma-glutamylcyclotransferase [Rhodoligotrophos defluvii]|uniref:gamma-glutamylcyclotransferase n=1 Tax=Rhodoligotrophos defluvii TaxID=2561934 RepID=UPI0010C9A475|nr:gamma-glutamylcyclotransferase [Rhodoligotrophos defluvii]
MQEFWVFGYGSLMWRPGFAYEEQRPALLRGAHRSLCVLSHVHRGTPEKPGLVLGLDLGGSCRGTAFRVAPENWAEVRAYLVAREQVTNVYREALRRISFVDTKGGAAAALVFLIDRRHPQYAGQLSIAEQVNLILQGCGISGRCPDYVRSTVLHLRELGIRDPELEALLQAVDDAEALVQVR